MEIGSRFPFIQTVLNLAEVDSTNDLARRLLASGAPSLPLLIQADRQTQGRGQRSNNWWSDSGSLTATIVIDPSAHGLDLEKVPRVSLATATAAVRAIRALYPSCQAGIRWPNDIEAEGRKLGGILSERVETADGPRLLVGIGLNVRTRLEDAPGKVRQRAASLVEWAENHSSSDPIAEMLETIVAHFPDVLRSLAIVSPDLIEEWNRLDTLNGSTVQVETGSETLVGIGSGIDDGGGLRLLRDGQTRIILAGRILRE